MKCTLSSALLTPLCLLLLVAPGCIEDTPPVRHHGVELKPIESFEVPLWTGTLKPDDPVVATVEGTPITVSMLQQQVDLAGADADPKTVLNRMIEFELLAREAFRPTMEMADQLPESKYDLEHVGEPMRKALARRWIEISFEDEISEADIPDEYLGKAYEMFRSRYDHFERFVIRDIQLLCCTQDNYEACFTNEFDRPEERVAHTEACIEHHGDAANRVRELVADSATPEEFKEIYESRVKVEVPGPDLGATYGVRAKMQDYDFQYDVDTSYEKQFEKIRYHIFYQEIMDGVRDAWFEAELKTPFITPVIKTPLGYHVIYVSKVQAERHWAVDHPEVQKELRKNIFTPWRQVYFAARMEQLCQDAGCELNHKRLAALQDYEEGRSR
jgi:hypothetical protein